MFPATYLSLFPSFPRNNKVFIAMSFDPRFDSRYVKVIEPALRSIEVNGQRLEPYRVDTSSISDSILTEILSGISQSRFVFADVSTIEVVNGKPFRNGNVMYEVGIAHAVRQPEEVLLFRSDNAEVLFDIANVRLNRHAPDEAPDEARRCIVSKVMDSVRELDLKKNMAIQLAADSLDNSSWMVLAEVQPGNKLQHPAGRTVREILGGAGRVAAIQRLLDIGAIRASYLVVTPESYEALKDEPGNLLSYECTIFGSRLLDEGIRRMGIENPETKAFLENRLNRGGTE